MSSLALAWQAISPETVEKGNLVEPEATNRFAPRPWLHFPPGALMMLVVCAAMLFIAGFQASMTVVRREGLRDGLRDGLEDAGISAPIASLVVPAARTSTEQAHRRHRHQANKLHVLLDRSNSATSSWSHDGS